MATIPLPERAEAAKGVFRVARENPDEAGRFLHYLNTAFPGFDWASILRAEAQNWQPYIDSRLSIGAFMDEVERYAAFWANQ